MFKGRKRVVLATIDQIGRILMVVLDGDRDGTACKTATKEKEKRKERGKRIEEQEGKREDQTLGERANRPFFLRETTGNYSMLLGGAVTAGGKTCVKASETRRLER
jgi:hypothetical protein